MSPFFKLLIKMSAIALFLNFCTISILVGAEYWKRNKKAEVSDPSNCLIALKAKIDSGSSRSFVFRPTLKKRWAFKLQPPL